MNSDAESSPASREREIFLGALERNDPGERAAYLSSVCGGNEELRRSVQELLGEENDLGAFLQKPALAGELTRLNGRRARAEAASAEELGQQIGPYKVVEKIGEGGWGVVYLAEQQQPVRRQIALKIIKLGMDTRQVIARFEAERQALALMEHPNIARVFEAGSTETGRPYFVMELVRGVKITDYCKRHNVSTRERLRLFIQVCHAIEHAHKHGVIHRDIKPSNILVTSQDGVPVPKVIDFGVAKASKGQDSKKHTVLTRFGLLIGTPAYMSPEQALLSETEIDKRSDIYSLGVLLYELLTGVTPFDADLLSRVGLDECRRIIREVEPACPSRRLSNLFEAELNALARQQGTQVRSLLNSLRGDLDWIVMKALEKDASRRYATANDLASDVLHYLNDQTVSARRPSSSYRFQKLVRRHKQAFAFGTVIAVLILSGIAVTPYLLVRAFNAEREARAAQQLEAKLRRRAEVEGLRAKDQAALARVNEYIADINLANHSLDEGNFGRAVRLLKKHLPEPGEKDLRGFEWRYLWQRAKGDEQASFPDQPGAVHSAAFSGDGKWLAVTTSEQLEIIDFATQSIVARIPGRIYSACFLPNGQGLLTSGSGGVRVKRLPDGKETKSIEGDVSALSLSRDGTRLGILTSSGLRLWDASAWTEIARLEGARAPLALSPDGTRLVAATAAGLAVWRFGNAMPELVLQNSTNFSRRFGPGPGSGRNLSFSPDGKWIVAVPNRLPDRDRFVLNVWDAQTGEESRTLPEVSDPAAHTGMISAFDFSPDGRWLATASMDHSICLWDFSTGHLLFSLHGHLNEVYTVAFSPDGKGLISGAKDGGLKYWAMQRPADPFVLDAISEPLGFSADGRILAALNSDRTALSLVNLATSESEPEGKIPLEPQAPRGPLRVALSDDLKTFAEALNDGRVRLWDTRACQASYIKVSDRPLQTLVLSPDGHQLITGGFQESLRWWDLERGTNLILGSSPQGICFSHDSARLAVFSPDNEMQLWDVSSRSLLVNLVLESSTTAAVFSPDGNTLATIEGPGDYENAIRLRDAATGKVLGVFLGHKQAVRWIAYSPDGQTLASASDDSTIKLWNVATQQELLHIHQNEGPASNLRFSPDGTLLVASTGSAANRRVVRLFPAPGT